MTQTDIRAESTGVILSRKELFSDLQRKNADIIYVLRHLWDLS